jgi:raffinose/stachyose/melibiose transport system permease protein
MRRRKLWLQIARETPLLLIALFFCLPLYLVITVSLKPGDQIFTSPLSLPSHPYFANFTAVWAPGSNGGLGPAFISSVIITASSVAGLVALGSLCAYAIARRPGKMSNLLYFLFVIGIIIPFQLGLIPLYVIFLKLGLIGSYLGMAILWIGVLSPLTVFLYTGFIRTLPKDYEEAARVDGASTMRTYVHVVLPLLRPITGTVAILTGLFIWNDFFVSLIFLSGSAHQTLPLAVYQFVGQYVTQWQLVFATVLIALAPVLLFFVVAQKQMIRGFSGGIRG